MCGIAGIWRFDDRKVYLQDVKTFTDSMSHRGPDGGGYEIYGEANLALGHRRLSIIDLSDNGKQPMKGPGDTWITFNGEIYNFIEVRKELQQNGFEFKTSSDTEVILVAYAKWGTACLNKFNGMFAFAIYDERKKELFIARDRFGVKPFHYVYLPGKLFAFASETIAFKSLPGYSRSFNAPNFMVAIDSPGYLDATDETIFENTFQLKAGHYAIVNQTGIKTKPWYQLGDKIVHTSESYDTQIEHFRDLFFDACKLRLRSDVSVASALSGGIDSSSVFCSIHHLAKQNFTGERLPANWQQAFSISFPGTNQDEAAYVELIKSRLNADVKIIQNNHTNLVEDITRSTILLDNIISTPIISASEVYRAMRANGITVSLDGHGGDELLFGYRSAVYEVLFEAHLDGTYDKNELAELYLLMTESPSSAQNVNAFNNQIHDISKRFRPTLKNKIKNLLARYRSNAQTDFAIPSSIKGHANRKLFKQFQYLELPYNLRDFDRASMQHSIEIRMPLLDYRLVEYAWSLPVSSKIGNGYTKRILRDAMKGIVPDEILQRKTKIGLSAPTANWMNGTLSEFVLDIVNSNSFIQSPYWNGKELSTRYTELTKNKKWTPSEASRAWSIINAHLISADANPVSDTHFANHNQLTNTKDYQQCVRCIMDNQVTKVITFDDKGMCNYCRDFDKMKSYTFGRPKNIRDKQLESFIKEIKSHGNGKTYDCIIGLSGGVDSTYVAYLAKQLGLRALAVHFDNGWNSELAVKNIENIINKTGFDLETYVVNWNEFKDLQRSYLKASVIDVEVLSDHMIIASLYKLCHKYKIKHIITGTNLATEYVIGRDWVYNKNDLTNIKNIYKKFGTVPLKTFPQLGFTRLFFLKKIFNVKSIDILNYIDYKKKEVKNSIVREFEWRDYGGKHYESLWTKFYQGYILPRKFGVDKRIAHLSNLILNNEISREQALYELKSNEPLSEAEIIELEEYVLKKLAFSKQEWDAIMTAAPIPHEFYGTEDNVAFVKLVKGTNKLKWKIIVDYLVPLKRTLIGKKK